MSNSDQDSVIKKDFEQGEPPANVKVVDPGALASARRKFDFFVLPVVCIYCEQSFTMPLCNNLTNKQYAQSS